ncbi:MAG: bifunctional aspartate kinase/homoserine dehydrogenase I [Bacteroidetes bacterium]|nr:bifunctional aspartate kinase/homoserine dehydrogenase I [Bacteroidota bacterium]
MKIIKFGGSSVENVKNIHQVFGILEDKLQGGDLAVVFSAIGGVTEQLFSLAKMAKEGGIAYREALDELEEKHIMLVKELLPLEKRAEGLTFVRQRCQELEDLYHDIYLVKEQSPRILDYVASFGERLSTFILAKALECRGIPTCFVDAREIIRTDDRFGQARVDEVQTTELIQTFFAVHQGIKIVTGFIAATEKGETTTLGRSGSDYTAALLAAALHAESLEIWTDVSGVLTCDPKMVYAAFTIPQLSYAEAMELSHFGAKVIFPATMQPAMKKNIPIHIKNTFEPHHPGTLIHGALRQGGWIKGISSRSDISLITFQSSEWMVAGGNLGRIFKVLSQVNLSSLLISQASSQHSICLAMPSQEALLAKEVIEQEFFNEIKSGEMDAVTLLPDLALIAAVGENMKHDPSASGRMFRALGQNNINVVAIAQGSSELNISAIIFQVDLQKALNALHEAFFLSEYKVVHLFLIGTGLIGKALLRMIAHQKEKLLRENQLDIQIHGIANSRYMAFDEDGFDLKKLPSLTSENEKMDLGKFMAKLQEMNFSNSVLVDCTASQEVAQCYSRMLAAKIAIVTPNKKANSGSLESYLALKQLAKTRGVHFLYETNVAAGLPVITTLHDLMLSGDRVLRIEAVLSGSLNFIFSELEKGVPFSEVVALAKEKGYTEPDPRDDLSGMDVARKVVILGREADQVLEVEDVVVSSLVPEKARQGVSVEEFMELLKEEDASYALLLNRAREKGEKLRFMATLEDGKAEIGLRSLPASHPFYGLEGSDNMILLTTDRYYDRPMIIRGPGAGAEVTAAGVFADVIRVGNYTRD